MLWEDKLSGTVGGRCGRKNWCEYAKIKWDNKR